MQAVRSLYGQERLELEDLIETEIDYLVELAYYKINTTDKTTTQYGVEVVKTEHLQNRTKVESKRVNLFTDNETKIDHILELLQKHKVTPIGLKETVMELIKTETL